MELSIVWMYLGFFLAAYSVIANDSIQTLGTFLSANKNDFPWYTLWFAASLMLIISITYGWYAYDGDISYERLTRIPYQEVQWYHALAPGILLLLTRSGIPVSTTFLVLSAFASVTVLEKMLVKSIVGYGIAAIVAYLVWIIIERIINEKQDHPTHRKFWRVSQWVSSGWLWFAWLQHDMANIAVFLPRQLDLINLIIVLISTILILGYVFYTGGGKIQEVVISKHGARFARSTTIINLVYAAILFYFKELNNLPMSTTWVFVGLLSGRELAISSVIADYRFKYVFPIIAKDFGKMLFGLGASVAIVLIIHQVIVPNGF